MNFLSTLVNKIRRFFGLTSEHRPNLMTPNAVNDRDKAIRELRKNQGMDNQKGDCPNCGAKFVTLAECSVCHKKACVNCLDYDPSEHKYYCEECSVDWGNSSNE